MYFKIHCSFDAHNGLQITAAVICASQLLILNDYVCSVEKTPNKKQNISSLSN